jgi:hypothetical protein
LYSTVIAALVITVLITRYGFESFTSYYIVTRLYNIIEYSLLAYLFFLYIKNKIVRKILISSIIPFATFALYDYFTANKPALPFLPLILEYLILLVFIIYFFFEVLQETVIEPIYHKSIFWISVAFILNFSGNFFLLLSSVNSFDNEAFRDTFTIIYSSVTILKNLLLCIAVNIKENKIDNDSFTDISIDPELDKYLPFKNKN